MITDKELRALRDSIYGSCSEENWAAVKENWRRPDSIKWLQERPPIVPMFASDFLPKKALINPS